MTRQALLILEQALSAPSQNSAELPDPLKQATTLASGDVVTVIRENRDADQLNLSK